MQDSILGKQVLNVVLVRACEARARRVSRVHGWVTDDERVDTVAVASHFAALAKGTAAEGARLDLDRRPTASGEAGLGIDEIVVEVA